jgi:hypothetical protein
MHTTQKDVEKLARHALEIRLHQESKSRIDAESKLKNEIKEAQELRIQVHHHSIKLEAAMEAIAKAQVRENELKVQLHTYHKENKSLQHLVEVRNREVAAAKEEMLKAGYLRQRLHEMQMEDFKEKTLEGLQQQFMAQHDADVQAARADAIAKYEALRADNELTSEKLRELTRWRAQAVTDLRELNIERTRDKAKLEQQNNELMLASKAARGFKKIIIRLVFKTFGLRFRFLRIMRDLRKAANSVLLLSSEDRQRRPHEKHMPADPAQLQSLEWLERERALPPLLFREPPPDNIRDLNNEADTRGNEVDTRHSNAKEKGMRFRSPNQTKIKKQNTTDIIQQGELHGCRMTDLVTLLLDSSLIAQASLRSAWHGSQEWRRVADSFFERSTGLQASLMGAQGELTAQHAKLDALRARLHDKDRCLEEAISKQHARYVCSCALFGLCTCLNDCLQEVAAARSDVGLLQADLAVRQKRALWTVRTHANR